MFLKKPHFEVPSDLASIRSLKLKPIGSPGETGWRYNRSLKLEAERLHRIGQRYIKLRRAELAAEAAARAAGDGVKGTTKP